MWQPKKKACRGCGRLRDAVVGVRHFDYSLMDSGYIAVSTTMETRFGRDRAPAGAVLVRPCCVLALRSCKWIDGTRTLAFVTHLDGEAVVATAEPAESLMARMGRYGKAVAYVA
jgi:hypothetical protein